MNQNNKRLNENLLLYFEGKLNEKEIKEVEEWIEISEENRLISQYIKDLYKSTDTLYALSKIDVNKALKSIHSKMKIRRDRYSWSTIRKIAAIILIPLLIGSAAGYFMQKSVPVNLIHLITNPGMTASITLPDGTFVTLNSNSMLIYPDRFAGNERRVELKGEAYFKVKSNKEHPFIIKTPQKAFIKVHGTQFNLEAYPADDEVSATLITGHISMAFLNKKNTWKEYMILPGQEISYSRSDKSIKIKRPITDVVTSWKDGKLIFNNTPFREVLKNLSKRFNVEFKIKNTRLLNSAYTGILQHQRLDRVLEYFKISSNIHFRYINDMNIENEKQIIEVY